MSLPAGVAEIATFVAGTLFIYALIKRNHPQTEVAHTECIISVTPEPVSPPQENFVVKCVLNCKNIVGECPIWDDVRNQLVWIDIEGRKLQFLTLEGNYSVVKLPERAGSFALCKSNERLLLALESGLAFFYFKDSRIVRLKGGEVYVQIPGTRSNDGRCDRDGRFVFGGFNGVNEGKPEWERNLATYSVSYDRDRDDVIVKKIGLPLVRCTNSICFSLDGTRMFHTDSPSREIQCFEYDRSTGDVGAVNTFVTLPSRKAGKVIYNPVPDGSIVDSSGNIWNCEWDGSRAALYKPSYTPAEGGVEKMDVQGSVIAEVELPVCKVTCACLGGPNLDWLFITSGRHLETESGGLFVARVAIPGVPESRFADV